MDAHARLLCARSILIGWIPLFVCVVRYQNELPKKIKSRGKDAHLNHEELVQTMKWKQIVSREFYPYVRILPKQHLFAIDVRSLSICVSRI